MTIDEAIQDLINSDNFKDDAKKNGKLRVALSRIRNGTANSKIKLDLLEKYGYSIEAQKPKKG